MMILFPSRLLQAGAAGYFTKGASMEEMVQAIRAVHSGQRYISPDVAQQLALNILLIKMNHLLTVYLNVNCKSCDDYQWL